MNKPATSTPPIIIRKMGFLFDDMPRHWFGGDPVRTHIVNGLHFVFPAGERFFIRSVKQYRDRVSDELRERIVGFSGQEAQHQAEHRRAFRAIEEQGYDVRSFLDWYEHLAYDVIEKSTRPIWRLAATAALEHYTAALGELVLSSDILDDCDPAMRDLLLWHACEEIEHKSVAFDVLQAVDPRYRIRALGFGIGTVTLFYFWGRGTLHMLEQEEAADESERSSAMRLLGSALRDVAPRILDYLRPDFHPDDHDNYHLAADYLQAIGRAAA